jgi:hypothetical protein
LCKHNAEYIDGDWLGSGKIRPWFGFQLMDDKHQGNGDEGGRLDIWPLK